MYTLKNVGLKMQFNFNPTSTLTFYCKFMNDIFNPTFGSVHILPKFELKQPSIFRVYK